METDILHSTFVPTAETALGRLSVGAASWFRDTHGAPTSIQRVAWPRIASGESVLISAPTGTGKTLAGFLPLLTNGPRPWPDGIVGLAIAPLKALANDQIKNLSSPTAPWLCDVRLGLRTGDTTSSRRRQLKMSPPHVLWTTPESLAVMLTQDDFRRHVAELRWVVIDEIHALAATKRGVDLSLSLERLEELIRHGPLQRIGLSATCEPLNVLARFLVGTGRSCRVVNVPDQAKSDITIEPLPEAAGAPFPTGFLRRLINRILPELQVNDATLIFANTRALCERIGFALKKRLPESADRIAIHHGSLARGRRQAIEEQFKNGELLAVVSSASLELGIDIGSVDGVVLVNPPGGVSRWIQRMGRAGHRPDGLKKGLVLCGHAGEILEAGVTASAARHRQLDLIAIPDQPLDVLCQHLIGMSIGRAWTRQSALELVRRADAFRNLTDDDFDACVRYLRGQKADRTEWLPSRLDLIDNQFTITSRRLANRLIRNLGTIQTEEPRIVRKLSVVASDPGVIIGELDDSYAKNLSPGDRFLLDGRCLTLERSDGRDLMVRETIGSPWTPRWHGGFVRIPEDLARRLFTLRSEAAQALRDGLDALERFLTGELDLGPAAARTLADFLIEQETVSEVPDQRSVLVEVVMGGGCEYAIHTPLHGPGNEAIARVAQHRLQREFGGKVFSVAVTLGVLLFHDVDTPLGDAAWRRLLSPDGFADDLDELMRADELTRSRFADIARTALMVLRQPLGGPRKVGGRDWIERRLFDQVADADPEFALMRQARREAVTVACDGAAALRHLRDVARRPIIVRPLAEPSPFAAAWLDAGDEAVHKQWHEVG